MDATLVTLNQSKSTVNEAYRTLQSNVSFSSVDQTLKTLTVTSPGVSEGKSTTSANLAITYSQTGQKVLLVDCDLRCPRIHHLFQLGNQKGLTNLLCLKQELEEVKQRVQDNLDVLTTGPLPPNPVELLNSQGMKQFIEATREKYDIIIFDTPPVGILTDAALIASQTDGALLVVASGKSEIDLLKQAKEQLNHAKANLIGAVMTMVPMQSKNYYRYYEHYGLDTKPKRRFRLWRKKR